MKNFLFAISVFFCTLSLSAGIPDWAQKDGHPVTKYIKIDQAMGTDAINLTQHIAEALKKCPECIALLYPVGSNTDVNRQMVFNWLETNEGVNQKQLRLLKITSSAPVETKMSGVVAIFATKEQLEDESFPTKIWAFENGAFKPFIRSTEKDTVITGADQGTYYLVKVLPPGYVCASSMCLEIKKIEEDKKKPELPPIVFQPSKTVEPAKPPEQPKQPEPKEPAPQKTSGERIGHAIIYGGLPGAGAAFIATQFKATGGKGAGDAPDGKVEGLCWKGRGDGKQDWGCVAGVTAAGFLAGAGLEYTIEYSIDHSKDKKVAVTLSPMKFGISWY